MQWLANLFIIMSCDLIIQGEPERAPNTRERGSGFIILCVTLGTNHAFLCDFCGLVYFLYCTSLSQCSVVKSVS